MIDNVDTSMKPMGAFTSSATPLDAAAAAALEFSVSILQVSNAGVWVPWVEDRYWRIRQVIMGPE